MLLLNKKKYLFVVPFLALVFLLAFLPVKNAPAYAESDLPTYNSSDDVYEISTADQLIKLSELVNTAQKMGDTYYSSLSYRLTSDIDLTGKTWTPIGLGNDTFSISIDLTAALYGVYTNQDQNDLSIFNSYWNSFYTTVYLDANGTIPASNTYDLSASYYYIYEATNAFYGSFDGNGHTVSNLSYLSSTDEYAGLFGMAKRATIQNVALSSSSVSLTAEETNYVGGIVGYCENSDIIGCAVKDSTLHGNSYVGGIIGKMHDEEEHYYNVYSALDDAVKEGVHNILNSPRITHTVSSCCSIANEIYSSDYAGGIVAFLDGDFGYDMYVKDCFNSSQILGVGLNSSDQAKGGGILGGTDEINPSIITILNCIGITSMFLSDELFVGAIRPASNWIVCSYCFFLIDGENDGRSTDQNTPDYGATRCTLLNLVSPGMPELLGGSEYWRGGGRVAGLSNVYAYPLPRSELPLTVRFIGYTVTLDGTLKAVHYAGFSYVYPSSDELTKAGYTLLGWKGNDVSRDFGDVQTLSQDLVVTSVWQLDAPALSISEQSYIYNGQNRTITPTLTCQAENYSVVYTWSKDEQTPFQANTVTIKNVSDSGTYTCYATITDPDETSVTSNVVTFSVTIQPKNLSVVICFSLDSAENTALKTHVYDGETSPSPLHRYTGLLTDHTLSASYTFVKNDQSITYAQTSDVGSYTISADVTVADSGMVDCTENYAISLTTQSYTVTPATITYSCVHGSSFSVYYDGDAHTLTSSDFTVVTVNNQVYTIDIAGSYTNVVTNGVLSYTVSAPNHQSVSGEVLLTILPIEVTLTPTSPISGITKVYNGTTTAPDVVASWFALSLPPSYDVNSPQPTFTLLSAEYEQANAGEDLTVTCRFEIDNNAAGNFVLLSDTYDIENCSITKKTAYVWRRNESWTVSKTYDKTASVPSYLSLLSGKYQTTDNIEVVIDEENPPLFDSVDAGSGKTVTVYFVLTETSSINYHFVEIDEYLNETELDSFPLDFSGSITPAQITITRNDSVTLTKTYDASHAFPTASILPSMYTVSVPNGDEIEPVVSSAIFIGTNVGTTTAQVTFSLDSSVTNYAINTNTRIISFPATVTARSVHLVSGSVVASNRAYDGTTNIVLTGGTLEGVLPSDTVSVILHGGTISSPNASTSPYEVEVTPITLSNSNYVLSDPTPTGITVTITKIPSVVHPYVEEPAIAYLEDDVLPNIFLSVGDTAGIVLWSSYHLSLTGEQDFTWVFTPSDAVNYAGQTGTITVNVIHKVVTNIYLSVQPNKTTYTALEVFSTTGMVVCGDQNSGTVTTIESKKPGKNGYVIEYPTEDGRLHYGDSYVTVRYNELSCQINITVNKITRALPVLSGTERTYDGQELSPYVANLDATIVMSGDITQTNKGDYTLSFSLVDTNNYQWPDGSVEPKEYSWHILPAGRRPLSISATSFVYSGEEKTVYLRNDDNADKVFYSVSDQSVFSAINVGQYAVRISLINDNYYWINPDDLTDRTDTNDKVFAWNVQPKKIIKPLLYGQPFVYSGSEQAVVTDTADEYTVTGDLIYRNAGSYTIRCQLKNVYENGVLLYGNYVWSDDQSTDSYVIHYTVNKKSIEIPQPAITSVTYNGGVFSVKMQSTAEYAVTGTLQATNVGTFFVSASLSDKINTVWRDNTSDTKSYTWYINPIYVTKPRSLRSNVYTGYEQTANISYSDFNSYYTLTNNTAKDVGSYVAHATLINRTNYRWDSGSNETLDIPWEIVYAIVDVPQAPANLLYNGFEQTAYIEPNAAYTITGNTGKDKGTYTATVALKDKNGYLWDDGTTSDKTFSWGIYGVTIVSDGESVPLSTTYELSQSLEIPLRTGYSFGGWYTSPDFSESSKITSIDEAGPNMVIYAKWNPVEDDDTLINNPGDNSDTSTTAVVSTETRNKLIAGAAVLGACIIAALLLLILGKRR